MSATVEKEGDGEAKGRLVVRDQNMERSLGRRCGRYRSFGGCADRRSPGARQSNEEGGSAAWLALREDVASVIANDSGAGGELHPLTLRRREVWVEEVGQSIERNSGSVVHH